MNSLEYWNGPKTNENKASLQHCYLYAIGLIKGLCKGEEPTEIVLKTGL